MKKIILYLITIFICVSCSQENKIYFGADWKETTQENAVYYRVVPKQVKGLWVINDFYITGEKQFVGQAIDNLANYFEGDATWYLKNGNVEQKIRYEGGRQIGYYTVKPNAKGSETKGWNEQDLIYKKAYEMGEVEDAANAVSTDTKVYEYLYANSSKVAKQHTSNVGYQNEHSFTLYFNKFGDTIGRLEYNQKSKKWFGKEVLFYELELTGKNEMITVQQINTYNSGNKIQTQYFNAKGVLIADGTLLDNKRYMGTFFEDECKYNKIQTFENGNITHEYTYFEEDNKEDELIGELSYVNNKPHTGLFYKCNSLATYKDGELNGASIQFADITGKTKEDEFNYKNGLKDGEYVIYQDEFHVLETGNYKEGRLSEVRYNYRNSHSNQPYEAYYLKADVKLKNNQSFISELSQYNSDTNELIKTFQLAKNDSDTYSYLEHGYHEIIQQDFNSDGFDDLEIRCNFKDIEGVYTTYYLFDSKTESYQHIKPLDDIREIVVNAENKTIKASLGDSYEESVRTITYGFSGNQLVKKLVVDDVYNPELDSIVTKQVFPVQLDKYPLLDKTLPPFTIIQNNKKHKIKDLSEKIKLNKEPFSFQFPGLINDDAISGFKVKVIVSYDKDIFEKAKVNQTEEESIIFSKSHTFAMGVNSTFLIVDNAGHNLLYYDETPQKQLRLVKKLNDEVLSLQYDVYSLHDGDKEKTIAEMDKPIYMVIYIDKNQDLRIDENELHYVSFLFK